MEIIDLFVVRAYSPKGTTIDSNCAQGSRINCNTGYRKAAGIFTVPQSVLAFPIATCVVVTIVRSIRTMARVESGSVVIPLAAALAVGCLIFGAIVSSPQSRPRSTEAWVTEGLVALTNSLVLFAAAVGIEKL